MSSVQTGKQFCYHACVKGCDAGGARETSVVSVQGNGQDLTLKPSFKSVSVSLQAPETLLSCKLTAKRQQQSGALCSDFL